MQNSMVRRGGKALKMHLSSRRKLICRGKKGISKEGGLGYVLGLAPSMLGGGGGSECTIYIPDGI